ncbi:MAG: hypothetical protein JKX79_12135 [Labilibaculum sp.]|nr:hypothetical protein [Labilibaculum sp.]
MKIIYTVLLVFVVLGAKFQTIAEKLGAVPTNFEITSRMLDLNVTDQIVLKRNITHHDRIDDAYAVYERYYFQFICEKKPLTTNRNKLKEEALDKRNHDFYSGGYFVSLFDEKAYVIYEFSREQSGVFARDYNSGKGGYFTYSIDLRGFPLILLDKVKRIDIQTIN